jgi:hypothetical protein
MEVRLSDVEQQRVVFGWLDGKAITEETVTRRDRS